MGIEDNDEIQRIIDHWDNTGYVDTVIEDAMYDRLDPAEAREVIIWMGDVIRQFMEAGASAIFNCGMFEKSTHIFKPGGPGEERAKALVTGALDGLENAIVRAGAALRTDAGIESSAEAERS